MEKVIVTKISIQEKSKDGKPYMTKNGKPFYKVGIQTDRYGQDWLSALAFGKDDSVMNLKEGEEYTIIVEENGQWKNFKLPTKTDMLEAQITEFKRLVPDIKKMLEWFNKNITSNGKPVPTFDRDGVTELLPNEIFEIPENF